jgi:hypothetical protein
LDNYEIRIERPGHQPYIYVSPQLSDHAAIRRAQSLAQEGDRVEVWRGLDCVYEKKDRRIGLH